MRMKKYVVEYRSVEWNRVIWKDGGYSKARLTFCLKCSFETALSRSLRLPGDDCL